MTSISEELKCVVKTKDGPICGFIEKNEDRKYYKFKAIPYAKPPVGSLRFLPPFPIEPWEDTIDCMKDAPLPICICSNEEIMGSEDCLYIEVSTPNITPKTPMPVMFWIGSYSFTFYIDNIFDPTLINDQDIVFVRCGFRLGPFGFLSINDYTAPGNCGLKDLVMALKWVQRNISVFGGNPDNVTIFGSASGGAIVHFMMLSPMASGLFHKAIIQSASALNNCFLTQNPCQPVMELAKQLGIESEYKAEVIEELRSLPTLDIMRVFQNMTTETHRSVNNDVIEAIFKPCIEVDLEGQPAFMTKSPLLITKSGNYNKVPLVIGSNNIERATLQFMGKDHTDFDRINEKLCPLVRRSVSGKEKLSENISHQLLKFYLGGDAILKEDMMTQYLKLFSDIYVSYYVNKTVKLQAQVAPEIPIYYFIVSYTGERSTLTSAKVIDSIRHSIEIPFVFRVKLPDICKESKDAVMIRTRVVKLWTNFAKTGNPTPDDDDPTLQITWDPVENNDKLNYLCIGSELTKGRNPFYERMNFLDKLHKDNKFFKAQIGRAHV